MAMLSADGMPLRLETQSALMEPAPLRYVRNQEVVSRKVAGETIVVPICRGTADLDSVYMFNQLGSELWVLLQEVRSDAELASWVTDRYEVQRDQALLDIQIYLAELRDAGLVHTVSL